MIHLWYTYDLLVFHLWWLILLIIYLFFKSAGPSFVKLGQLLSVRSDLIGIGIAQLLSKFQDNVEPFDDKSLQQILQSEYGDKFKKIFKR